MEKKSFEKVVEEGVQTQQSIDLKNIKRNLNLIFAVQVITAFSVVYGLYLMTKEK